MLLNTVKQESAGLFFCPCIQQPSLVDYQSFLLHLNQDWMMMCNIWTVDSDTCISAAFIILNCSDQG